jgi:flagellar hook assembly protein FlgD
MQIMNTLAALASPAAATTPAAPTPTTSASSSTSTTTDPTSSLANESTFLKLLMAQVQNQDPMNPTDSTQFMGQLVSFSQLEQLLGINQGVQTLVSNTPPPTTPTTPIATPAQTNPHSLAL